MEDAVAWKIWFPNELHFSKVTLTMLTLLWPLEMKNLPIGKQIQEIAGASVYQHLLPGWQEHWGLSFLNLTYKNNKEFNCERRIKSSPEKSPFFSHSNFWTWPSQQKCPALTPYHSWCTITLNTGASSISMDEYSVFHFVQVLVVILLVQVLCLYRIRLGFTNLTSAPTS